MFQKIFQRLRGRIQELTGNRKTRCGRFNTIEPLYAKWTDAFRIEMLALKRRQENRRFDTLSGKWHFLVFLS